MPIENATLATDCDFSLALDTNAHSATTKRACAKHPQIVAYNNIDVGFLPIVGVMVTRVRIGLDADIPSLPAKERYFVILVAHDFDISRGFPGLDGLRLARSRVQFKRCELHTNGRLICSAGC